MSSTSRSGGNGVIKRGGWRGAAVAGVLSMGMLAGGCGGSGSSQPDKPAGSSQPDKLAAASKSHKPSGSAAARRPAPKHADRKRRARRERARKAAAQHRREAASRRRKRPRSFADAAAAVPESQRARVAKKTAALTFKILGFHPAQLTVTPTGDAVRATVTASDACSNDPGSEGTITTRIRQALPFVRSVRITVVPSGQPLAQYVRAGCRQLGLPGGRGPVVLTLRGSNFADTKPFTVHSRRWTVEYVNSGSFLQVFPLKGDEPGPGAFTVSKRKAGRQVMTGAGTYRLRIGAMGGWVVRVRDGA